MLNPLEVTNLPGRKKQRYTPISVSRDQAACRSTEHCLLEWEGLGGEESSRCGPADRRRRRTCRHVAVAALPGCSEPLEVPLSAPSRSLGDGPSRHRRRRPLGEDALESRIRIGRDIFVVRGTAADALSHPRHSGAMNVAQMTTLPERRRHSHTYYVTLARHWIGLDSLYCPLRFVVR